MTAVEKFLTYLVAVGVAGAGLFNILYSWLSHHPGRYLVVQEYLPLGVIRSTWLLSIFTGLTLLFLGWGLAKRKRRAWFFALVALALAAGAHLTRGLDYDAAFVNLALLVVLLLLRHSYTVASDPASLGRSLLVSGTLFLTLYVYGLFGFYLLDRHFGARFDLTASAREAGRVLFTGSYPSRFPRTHRGRWFLDSLWFGEILALGYGTGLVFQPVLYRRRVRPEEVRRAREILNRWGCSTLAFLLLLPDKSYFFSSSGHSVIGYTVVGNIAVALGDPVGPPAEAQEVIEEFRDFCHRHDWYPVFFQVTEEFLPYYAQAGLEKLKIGEEAIIDLATFSLEGGAMKAVRQAVRRAERQGCRVEFHQPPLDEALLKRLKVISDAWLKSQHGTEKRFALGWFDYHYLRNCPVATVVGAAGKEIAFANIVPVYQGRVGTIDLMRRLPEAPNGTMELLFVALAEYFREQGMQGFSLGLAPLAGLGGPGAPLSEKTAHLLYEHFNVFYSFKGLRQFKEKFHPYWEPRYLIYPAPWLLPKAALAVVRANSGGSLRGYWQALKLARHQEKKPSKT